MAQNPIATITMKNGDTIRIELYPEKAPNTVKSFISLANSGFYSGVIFHRVVKNFVIQGGDPTGTGRGGPGYCIPGEFAANGFSQNDISHVPGVISMARAQSMNSGGSQFFIVTGNALFLDGQYAAFGKVMDEESMNAVEKIHSAPTDFTDRPLAPMEMASVTVETFGVDYGTPETLPGR